MLKVKQRVRATLKRQQRSQNDLARALGISGAYLSDLLNHKRRLSLTMAMALERETGIPAKAFAEAA